MTAHRYEKHCAHCRAPFTAWSARAQWCTVHQRMNSMRKQAAYQGKTVPTWEQLDDAYTTHCRECRQPMSYASQPHNAKATTASLQHERDGTFSIICTRCNLLEAAAYKTKRPQ